MSEKQRGYLCTIEELQCTGAMGIERDSSPVEVVVVANGEEVRAYINSCPHMGMPLEMFPNKFLDETREHLVCSTHGARFNVSDGICTFGPCRGDRLQSLPLYRSGDSIYLNLAVDLE